MHVNKVNDLPQGNMLAGTMKKDNGESKIVFFIKDSDFPEDKCTIQSALLFFILEVNDKYVPFIYYVAKFGNSNRFIYNTVIYLNELDKIEDLLLDTRTYCFVGKETVEPNKRISCNLILDEKVNKALNDEVAKILESFKSTKECDRGSAQDFIDFQNSGMFANFIGKKENAFKRIEELSKFGLVVDLNLMRSNEGFSLIN